MKLATAFVAVAAIVAVPRGASPRIDALERIARCDTRFMAQLRHCEAVPDEEWRDCFEEVVNEYWECRINEP